MHFKQGLEDEIMFRTQRPVGYEFQPWEDQVRAQNLVVLLTRRSTV